MAGSYTEFLAVRVPATVYVVDGEELGLGLAAAGARSAVARDNLCSKHALVGKVMCGFIGPIGRVLSAPLLVPGPLVRGSIAHVFIIPYFARNVNKEDM